MNEFEREENFNEIEDDKKKSIVSNFEIISRALKYDSQGDTRKAEEYYKLFLYNGCSDARAFNNLGLILQERGEINSAIKLFKDAIKYYPDKFNAFYNLAILLKSEAQLDDAELFIKKAIKLNPKYPSLYYTYANILRDKGDLGKAKLLIEKAIELNPSFLEAYDSYAIILKELGELNFAKNTLYNALKLNSDQPSIYNNLGLVLLELEEIEEAEIAFRKSIKLKIDFAIAYNNLANLLCRKQEFEEALIYILHAIKYNPNFADAYNNLGKILKSLTRLEEASISFIKAIELDSSKAIYHYNLGNTYCELFVFEKAVSSYDNAIHLNPNNSTYISSLLFASSMISDWHKIEQFTPLIHKLGITGDFVSPLNMLHLEDNPANHLSRSLNCFKQNYKIKSKKLNVVKKEKVHIGYFSADFREHPVMLLMVRTFELHDKSKYNIFLYSLSPTNSEDKLTKRIKSSGCIFRDINDINDIEAVDLARKDNLDIAIDLMGHTKGSRLSIFSYRVAPIQVNYHGYPGSIGSPQIDYLIADKTVIPEQSKIHYSEKVLYKPHCYLCFDDQREISLKDFKRKDCGLEADSFVLAAFHRIHKITNLELNSWSRILKNSPQAIIWIRSTNSIAENNIRLLFEERGISANRIIFAKRLDKLDEHLSRHNCADLFLDTFNYNGHSTTIDSLWCGLPVVSLIGESFSARVSASVLTALNLTELIANDFNQYEQIVIDLSTQPTKLNEIKEKLKYEKVHNKIFDSIESTRNLENIYSNLLQKYN